VLAVRLADATEVEAERGGAGGGESAPTARRRPMFCMFPPYSGVGMAQTAAPIGAGGSKARRGGRPSTVSRTRGSASTAIVQTVPSRWWLPTKPSCRSRCSNDRLLVKIPREDGERRSSGGILIPATAQVAKRLVWAEVVGVGQNVRTVQVGDHVLFRPRTATRWRSRARTILILRERDIHAVAAERVEGSTGLYL
jgi:chaperonin GroES